VVLCSSAASSTPVAPAPTIAMSSWPSAPGVVLGDAVAAAGRAGLDLAGVHGDGEIGDGGVFGLAAAVADDGGVAGALGLGDAVEGLGEGADLVDLDEDAVGDAFADASAEAFVVGDEEIVADELHAVAEGVGECLPAGPVVFGHAIFDADDGEAITQLGVEGDHGGAVEGAAFAGERVGAVAVELAGGDTSSASAMSSPSR
jgi:hypothetical protein